jgi:hypothetical protein
MSSTTLGRRFEEVVLQLPVAKIGSANEWDRTATVGEFADLIALAARRPGLLRPPAEAAVPVKPLSPPNGPLPPAWPNQAEAVAASS